MYNIKAVSTSILLLSVFDYLGSVVGHYSEEHPKISSQGEGTPMGEESAITRDSAL